MPSSPRSLPSRSGLSRRSVVIGGLAVLPLLSGCTPDSSGPDADEKAPRTRTAAPSAPVVLAADALAASAALFTSPRWSSWSRTSRSRGSARPR